MSATAPALSNNTVDNVGVRHKIADDRQLVSERAELFGDALELFRNRYLDTFTIERNGVEIEFYRPVDATKADVSAIREDDEELADRLERGSALLDRWRTIQRDVMSATASPETDIETMLERGEQANQLAQRVLSAHAVGESFRDPAVWAAIFPHGDDRQDLFEDFFSEGSSSSRNG